MRNECADEGTNEPSKEWVSQWNKRANERTNEPMKERMSQWRNEWVKGRNEPMTDEWKWRQFPECEESSRRVQRPKTPVYDYGQIKFSEIGDVHIRPGGKEAMHSNVCRKSRNSPSETFLCKLSGLSSESAEKIYRTKFPRVHRLHCWCPNMDQFIWREAPQPVFKNLYIFVYVGGGKLAD